MSKHEIQVLDMVYKATYNVSVKQRRVESSSDFTLIFFAAIYSKEVAGGRQMQSIFIMPCDDMAGDACGTCCYFVKEDGDDIARGQQMLSDQHRRTSVL